MGVRPFRGIVRAGASEGAHGTTKAEAGGVANRAHVATERAAMIILDGVVRLV